MGVPHQAFLILVSPNPLFYDLKNKISKMKIKIIKREIQEVIRKFRFECEEGARMGVPHQAFLILMSPNPLFYDSKNKISKKKLKGKFNR